jgi:RNA polymerase sigma factor (sigma-70 family)
VTGSSARPLLFGVASNVVRNAHRSMRRHRAALGRVPSPAPTDLDTHALASRLDAQRGIGEALHALKALSPGERDVVVLVLWSGLSYDEAANVLGIPIGTVRSRVSRVRGRLRDSLASSYDRITQE